MCNPIKAGGSESMYRKKALENRYRVEVHVHNPICQCQLIEKKIRPIASIVWVQGRVEKKRQKGVRKMKKYFCFVLNKYQSVTHVSISIFHGLYKNIVLRYVALVTKKVMGYFRFFFQRPDFFSDLYKTLCIKKSL